MTQWLASRPRRSGGTGPADATAPVRVAADGADPARPAASRPVQPVNRHVVWVGAAVFAVLMVLSGRYGFHRDELYFLDSARHLQAGYVDQPVFTPLVARISLWLFGLSLTGLRLWPALAAWATVIVSGLIARELGGGRRPQLLTAIGTATMPSLLAIDHILGPTAFDMLAWLGLALVVIRIGRTGDCRWWLAGGVILGLGLANKHSVGFFALALFGSALLTSARRLVLNWWFLAGTAIAAAFTVPDIWWQAQHQWATIAMTQALNQENGGPGNSVNWVIGQLIMVAVALIWVWVTGLRFLWRSEVPLWRTLAWAYVLLFILFAATTGGKIYYLAGTYPYLLAAGFVAMDERLARPGQMRKLLLGTALSTALALPIVLPVLPAADIGWIYKLNQTPAESVGWPELVQTVHKAWFSLPSSQRARAVIFTSDYGEAGAVNELGPTMGLPEAVSGDNTEWWWGPGNPRATTVVAVAPGPIATTGYGAYLRQYFASVRQVATLSNPAGLRNQEWGGHVYVCTGPRKSWAQLWPMLRHYG